MILQPTFILEAKGLSKKVSTDRWLFHDLSLSIRAGEQLALQGASGVGKSTLLNLLAGLDQPDAGCVLYQNQDLALMSNAERLQLRRNVFGFVFQAFHLMPHLTVLQNAMVPCLLAEMPLASASKQVGALLDALGLAQLADAFPASLSGGEQQRLALARALVHQPQLVLADEPTGNLDPKTATLALDLLCSTCRTHGATLVMVTHSSEAAARLDRSFVLSG